MDPDSDPDHAIFVADLQEANKKLIKKKSFSADYFLKLHIHHLSKKKAQKKLPYKTLFLLDDKDDRRIRIRIHISD